jgi:hypothetical protein
MLARRAHSSSHDAHTARGYEFAASAGVVAITADTSTSTAMAGASEGASGGKHDAAIAGTYRKGVAVFAIVKGGLTYDVSIAGQKFSYAAPQTN